MVGFYAASDYVKCTLVLIIVTLLVHLVSFGSPYWSTRSRIVMKDDNDELVIIRTGGNAGLWTGCMEGECYERYNLWTPDWIHASQTFMTLSLVLLCATAFLMFLYTFHREYDRDKRLIAVSLSNMIFTLLCTLLAFLTWAGGQNTSNHEMISWAFYLAVLSDVLSLFLAYFIYRELKRPLFDDKVKLMPREPTDIFIDI